MQKTKSQKETVAKLLSDYGQSYAANANIHVRDKPAPLFQLLVLSLMLSARIASEKAVSATRSLFACGFTTPDKMAGASWQDRVDAITDSGYKRYDERTASQLGDLAQKVLADYNGDLRRLRARADGDVNRIKTLLLEFNGVGPLGADIFLREVQGVWPEIYPYADERVLTVAGELRLPDDAEALGKLCPRPDFARLTAALIRVKLDKAETEFTEPASAHSA